LSTRSKGREIVIVHSDFAAFSLGLSSATSRLGLVSGGSVGATASGAAAATTGGTADLELDVSGGLEAHELSSCAGAGSVHVASRHFRVDLSVEASIGVVVGDLVLGEGDVLTGLLLLEEHVLGLHGFVVSEINTSKGLFVLLFLFDDLLNLLLFDNNLNLGLGLGVTLLLLLGVLLALDLLSGLSSRPSVSFLAGLPVAAATATTLGTVGTILSRAAVTSAGSSGAITITGGAVTITGGAVTSTGGAVSTTASTLSTTTSTLASTTSTGTAFSTSGLFTSGAVTSGAITTTGWAITTAASTLSTTTSTLATTTSTGTAFTTTTATATTSSTLVRFLSTLLVHLESTLDKGIGSELGLGCGLLLSGGSCLGNDLFLGGGSDDCRLEVLYLRLELSKLVVESHL